MFRLVERTLSVPVCSTVLAIGVAFFAPPLFAEVVVRVPQDQPTLTAAVAAVPNAGTIELAAGTYASPTQGFQLSNLSKGFTVRAAPNSGVYLDGGNARPVLRVENSSLANGRPIVFEGLTFRNGSSSIVTTAGGVTIRRGEATFVDCTFDNNQRLETGLTEIAGGGLGVSTGARVFLLRTKFTNNRSKNNGGGLAVWDNGVAYLHESEFYANRTDVSTHRSTAAGGAISVVNARLFVTNSRFEGNRSGYVGGAIYGLGSWFDPVGIPSTEIWIANSSFVANEAFPNGVVTPGPTEAGAVHAEDQTTVRIYHSRFQHNRSEVGAAVNNYRGIVEIEESVFIANSVDGSGAGGFGGAISVLSNDTSSAEPNRRAGALTLRRSYLRGTDPPTVAFAAKAAGCIFASGDQTRRMGSVTPQGDAASTRATIVLEDVLLDDCDVSASSSARGGGFDLYLTDATFTDLMVLQSDALGSSSSGGAGRMTSESLGTIANATFARNSAVLFGGALYLQGSDVDVADSRFVWNEISPGILETIGSSFGAALFTAGQNSWPTAGIVQNQVGAISSSIFSQNIGLPIFDDDRNGAGNWLNDQRYNGNTFYNTTFGTDIYTDALACCKTAAELNALVVNRTQGNTDKSQVNNSQPGTAPVAKDLRIVPTQIIAAVAAGDLETATQAYAGFAWGGGTATFDGGSISGNAGVEAVTEGIHTLTVAGQNASDEVVQGPTPAVGFSATPISIASGASSNLAWQTLAGDFLQLALDQGLSAGGTASGNVDVSPVATTTYRVFLFAKQGGSVSAVTVEVDEANFLFADGFETNGTGQWSTTVP